jgi:dihydrofolate reductase
LDLGRLIVVNHVTIDGVMQAPGMADEDRRGDFPHGGWAVPFGDEILGAAMGEMMSARGLILLGRRTYQDFACFWPKQDGSPFREVLASTPKFVASRSLSGPLEWENSILLKGEARENVAGLKRGSESDISLIGSGALVRSLQEGGLIDQYVLTIHPLLLGTGRRLFDGGDRRDFSLIDVKPTTTGVLIATYRPN